jgi:hypothetical protein
VTRRAFAFLGVLVLCGCAASAASVPRHASAPTTRDPSNVRPYLPVYRPTPAVLRVADPVRVEIPALHVDAVLVPLGLRSDGSMDVPANFADAGWYTNAPRPEETGAAVVTSTRRPAPPSSTG